MKKAVLLSLFGFLMTCAAFAQTGTATISGRVTDPSGAVVPGVEVTITNVQTGIDRVVKTNDVGLYVVPFVQPGEYRIGVTAEGFRKFVRSGIVLQVDQRSRQDVALAVGATEDKMEVTATAEQYLKPVSSELGEVIGSELTHDLPLNGRSVYALIALNAGVTSTSASFFKGVGVDLSLNGQRSSTNAFLVDGMDNVEFASQAPNNSLQADAVAEFNILTNNFSAEYGRASGGVINVQMRSGTNKFNGTLFEFLRNDVLDATDYFTNRAGNEKQPFRFNQFGGTLGGPIIKNKTFFFVAYQGTRSRWANTAFLSVPPMAWRNGDFSDLLPLGIQLYDPYNITGQIGPFPIRAEFTGNQIPLERQNSVGRRILDLYPEPNRPGAYLNYVTTLRGANNEHELDVKLDHQFSSRDTLTGRWNFSNLDYKGDPLFGDEGGGGGLPAANTGSQNTGVGYTHVFNSHLLNELRYSYVRRRGDSLPSGYGKDLNNQIGIPGIATADPTTSGLAFIGPAGFSELGGQVFFPQILTISSQQIADTLTYSRGRHAVKVGVDYHLRKINLFQEGFPRGFFAFDPLMTAQPCCFGIGGNSVASMLVGAYTFGQRDVLDHTILQTNWELSNFFQDDIRVNSRLTLNLGLRYDLFTPAVEAHDRQANFDMETKTMLLAGQNGNSRTLVNTDKNNFAPRVGFALSLTDDKKTVLRGGYGITYFAEQNALATLDRLSYNPPFYYLQTMYQNPYLTQTPRAISEGLPAVSAPDPAQPFGKIGYRDPNLPDAYVQGWNLNLQRQLTSSMTLDVAYAGSHGVHLLSITNPNQTPAGTGQPNPISDLINPLFTMRGNGDSNYHSLQVKVNRQISKGLAFLGSYTWSKAIDDTVGYWPNNGMSQMPQDSSVPLSFERGLSDWDMRHRFVYSFSWEIPVGLNRRFLNHSGKFLDALLGGWQVTGIFNSQTGTPFSPLISTNVAGTAFGGALRPDRAGNGTLSDRSIDMWFDKSAFTLPEAFTFGNSGRNILIGPGITNLDAGLFKNFAITERSHLQFRVEFFNLTNTPHFGLPNPFIDQPQGGTITGLTTPPRQIQFGLKLFF